MTRRIWLNTLPTEEQINGAAERRHVNANLFGYELTGKPLSTDEAAEVSGLSRRNLEQARVKGDGPPFIKRKSRILYPEPLLLDWLAQGLRTNTYDA